MCIALDKVDGGAQHHAIAETSPAVRLGGGGNRWEVNVVEALSHRQRREGRT